MSEVDFVSNSLSSIDLDFKDIVLFLSEMFHEVVLSTADSSHYCAVFSYSIQLNLDLLLVLVLRLIASKGFLLRSNPILVESSKSILVEVVCPDC